ncbi:MAG: heat-inducible transcriptional repressor HrcA [Rhodothermales bacterium]
MSQHQSTYSPSFNEKLSVREGEILRLVVRSFIDTAGPIGSRFLAKRFHVGLSAASIRNTMSDLEERGLLDHPYTSAGRIPTELGYRAFVDQLMQPERLSADDQAYLQSTLEGFDDQPEVLLKECSRILGRLSNLLGVVLSPKLMNGILERLELVPLSSSRIMFVISLEGGLVKTVILELHTTLGRRDLDDVVTLLNSRLAGLSIDEIRKTYANRMRDVQDEPTGVVKLVLKSSNDIFSDQENGRVSYAGAQNIVAQPEFLEQPKDLKNLVKLLENENFIVELLESETLVKPGHVNIRIGSEISAGKVDQYSIVTARYRLGNTEGTIGVIGPKRMNYSHVFSLVEGMSTLLTGRDNEKN